MEDTLLSYFPGKPKKIEGELQRFIVVWTIAMLALCYCHTIGKLISPGKTRFLSFLPVILLFLYLPLNLNTIFLGGPTSFFLSWLATFRLLLFSFGQGPLVSSSPVSIPLHQFLLVSCLPIKIQQIKPNPSLKSHKSPLTYSVKSFILAILVPIYQNRDDISPYLIKLYYCVFLYVALELFLAIMAILAGAWLNLELEEQFNEPYLATSIQDFWGKRWNLMVTTTLHPAIYDPVLKLFARFIGRRLASLPAVISSFLVSGLMHELIFFHIGGKEPNWKLTRFFVLHGVCLAIEIALKKMFYHKFTLPRIIGGPAAVGFALGTGIWLFIPAAIRSEFDVKAYREATAFIGLVKNVGRIASL